MGDLSFDDLNGRKESPMASLFITKIVLQGRPKTGGETIVLLVV